MTVRLLKVLVQPVFVADQDDDLVEIPVQPVTLSATQWKNLDPEGWAKDGADAVEAQMHKTPLG